MDYQYKMVQTPPEIYVRSSQGGEAAAYLEQVVNEHAKKGWEFYRIDSIGVKERPGCLASLLGARAEDYVYYVITFRRQTGPDKLDAVISALNNLSTHTSSVEQPAKTSVQSVAAEKTAPAVQAAASTREPSETVTVEPGIQLDATVIPERAILRRVPAAKGTIYRAFKQGTVVVLTGRSADSQWVECVAGGWADTSDLEISGDVQSLPISTTTW